MSKRGNFYFITGGARSGKSSFAERLALNSGKEVRYIATAEALDEEMATRIKEHQKRRPASWITIEEPYRVTSVLEDIGKEEGMVLIDCLTLLISNLLFPPSAGENGGLSEDDLLLELKSLARLARESCADVIIVSNELGLGVVPEYPQARLFRDMVGWANQIMAREADHAFFLVSGVPLDLKKLCVTDHL